MVTFCQNLVSPRCDAWTGARFTSVDVSGYTGRGGNAARNVLASVNLRGHLEKGKNMLPWEEIISCQSRTLFRKG